MSKTTIEYKGVVTDVEAGHSAVVKCGGCEMEAEVIVRAGQGGGASGVPIPIETGEELDALLETVTDDDVGKIYSLIPSETAELGIPPLYFVLTKENE